jgi:hypothetical protein
MPSYPAILAVKKDDKDKLFNKIYCNFQKLYFRLIVACTLRTVVVKLIPSLSSLSLDISVLLLMHGICFNA